MKFEEFLQDHQSPTSFSRGGGPQNPSSRGGGPQNSSSWGGGPLCPPSDDDEPITPEPEEEIEIQKAVVESLAADKVKIEEEASLARERSAALEREKAALAARVAALEGEVASLKAELARTADRLARNEATPASSKVALLERNVDLDDRFEGETRDHVLEALREARDAAEKEGRNRRAQILEAVLLENAPVGELAARRAALEKLFADNGNIVNGEVMRQLTKLTIQYRDGETYLLPSEILKRIY